MPYFNHHEHRYFYRERGPEDSHLLLILPGNTASSACHRGELTYFGQLYHAVSFDFLGTGQSDRLDSWPLDWWQQGARDAVALIQHLGEEHALVMGTSGGAVVALWMAILCPDRVRAVIADSFEERFTREMLHKNVLQARANRTIPMMSFWQRAHGDDWEQVVLADTDLLQRFAHSGGDWFEGRLAEIDCPVLLIASTADQTLPDVEKDMVHMSEQIRHSRLFLAEEGQHPLMWSQPDVFRQACDTFLDNVLKGA